MIAKAEACEAAMNDKHIETEITIKSSVHFITEGKKNMFLFPFCQARVMVAMEFTD